MGQEMDLKKMKVTDLKAELTKRGLPSDGLKADLIYRLQARLDEEEFGLADDVHPAEIPVPSASPAVATTLALTPTPTPTTSTTSKSTTTTNTTTTTIPIVSEQHHRQPDAGTDNYTTTNTSTVANNISSIPVVSTNTNNDYDTTKSVQQSSVVNKEKVISSTNDIQIGVSHPNSTTGTISSTPATTGISIDIAVEDPEALEEKKRKRAERFGIAVTAPSSTQTTTDRSSSKRQRIIPKKGDDDDDDEQPGTSITAKSVVVPTKGSIFGDTLLPLEEIERRLKRAGKFDKVDDPVTLELKAMLRKHKFGLTQSSSETVSTSAGTETANAKQTSLSTSFTKQLEAFETNIKEVKKGGSVDTKKGGKGREKEVIVVDDGDVNEEVLLPKDEIERRLQRAAKFGVKDDENTIKLKAMLRKYRFQ